MYLSNPGWLILIAALPFVFAWRRGDAPGIPLPGAGSIDRRMRLIGAAPDLLRVIVLTLLILALARPRTPGGVRQIRTEGVPIAIALDVSSSMLAQDWRCPARSCDRLTVAKETIDRFLAARPDDPVALVAFAGEAITLVPLTTHQQLIRSSLGSVRVGLLDDGTAVGDGLATAVNRLRDAPGETRVVVLMSDGQSNRGDVDPLAAARAAAALGIQVHTIAVGSAGVAPVPIGRAPAGFEYEERPVGVDEVTLREIARVTGGDFHHASDPATLDRVYARIDRLVRASVETRTVTVHREWYLWLLALAAGGLLLEWSLRASRWGVVP